MTTNISGRWSAVVDINGRTVYQSNGTTYDGPVQLVGGATLYITSGAIAEGVTNSGNVPYIIISSGGILLSSTITNGYVSALGGATTSASHFNSDPVRYYSGAQSIGDSFYASGYGADSAYFSAGSIITNVTASAGGPMIFYSGATVNGVTVSSGAVATFSSGSVVSGLNIMSGGSAFISTIVGVPGNATPVMPASGVTMMTGVWSAVLSGTKTIYKNAAGTSAVEAPVRISGGTLYIGSGATVSGLLALGGTPVISVLSGGILLNSQINNGYVYVDGGGLTSGNLLNSNPARYSAGASSVRDIFLASGYGANIAYALSGATIISPQLSDGGPMVVSSGAIVTDPVVTSGGQLTIYGGSVTTCFLAGAMIETPAGRRAVETLCVGDEILVYRGAGVCVEKLSRVHKAHASVQMLRDDDMAGYPVRLCVGSLGSNIPDQDFLVTAEHCFYFEGGFVPIRMLVNGQSIRYDRDFKTYEYYHVELASHEIIRANNVLTESYLDTVTMRAQADSDGQPCCRSWASHGAAPLRVDRAFVEPIYRSIITRLNAGRKAVINHEHDHGLYLVTDSGQRIEQNRRSGDQVLFAIPPGIDCVRLVSRSARPFDIEGPFVDDRRELGILVSDVTLYRPGGTHSIRAHLDRTDLPGWDANGGGDCRWTLGHATLPIELPIQDDPALLCVRIMAAGPYRKREPSTELLAG